MEYVRYGIDLGTTNSCVARANGAEVKVFQNNDQMNVTPSVVRLLKSGRMVVGKRAYNAVADDPDNIALEFKRWMGQKGGKDFPAADCTLTAESLSAEVLKSLKEDVKRADGLDLTASVVTVPAAFGALQCDATARACLLAGLLQAPLLQEPLAAAIAYGVTPGARDQRWMVFDLGGGTLDIAVVSTRDGRLHVLEHRGNNLLGGKDIDRRIAENRFLPALAETFRLPDPADDAAEFQRLLRRLLLKAEEAKIDLCSSEKVVVSLVDLGSDAEGRPIELELTLAQADLEQEIEPLLDRALRLAEEALSGARINGQDLDRVLLVGGPTQMPALRRALEARLETKVDCSLDPMTAVARGAAIYAATIERTQATVAAATPAASRKAKLLLAYEPVSAKTAAQVAGKVDGPSAGIVELKIDAESGLWTSGWFPLKNGAFELPVTLQEGKTGRFFIYARDRMGNLVDVEPEELSIRHGLVIASPPLPHTIAVEVSRSNGKSELDPIFKRGTPLPAERSVSYRSDRACKPQEPDTSLAIKLWEGEELADPEANVWVGNVNIDAKEVRRTIPEGSEIEITIRLDASRLITVEAFVPVLNQHFSNKLYVAQEEEKDYNELSAAIPDQLAAYRNRLEELQSALPDGEKAGLTKREELRRLKSEIDELAREAGKTGSGSAPSADPDQSKRVVESARNVRSRLSHLEEASGVDPDLTVRLADINASREGVQELVSNFGSALEKKEFQLLEKQLERALEKNDDRVLKKIAEAFDSLRWRVLFAQDWWWRGIFDSMNAPGRGWVNATEAEKLLMRGEEAIRTADGETLRSTVRELWKLQPKSEMEQDQERAMRSGLRRY
jgi:molecular chaperone DnaK